MIDRSSHRQVVRYNPMRSPYAFPLASPCSRCLSGQPLAMLGGNQSELGD
jgi:hypothetical protein